MPPLTLPKETSVALGGLLLLAILWHLSLPSWFYHTPGTFLEGPLPALAGATTGLWLRQGDFDRRLIITACGWAALGSVVAIVAGGLPLLGPWQVLIGFYALLRTAFHIPFLAAISAMGSPYLPYVLWMGVKTLLLWGAAAYVFELSTRYGLRDRLRARWSDHGEQRAFSVAQRQQWQTYRQQYMAAVKTGDTLPAAPAGLVPVNALGAGTWHNRAKFAYWALRIGIAIGGVFGLYAAAKQQLFGMGAQLLLPALFGAGQ